MAAQAGAQAQEEHSAPQRLHGGIIDQVDGAAKRGLKVEADPA